VAILLIESARETHVPVAVSINDVGIQRGRVSCSRYTSRSSWDKGWHNVTTHPFLVRRIVGELIAWCFSAGGTTKSEVMDMIREEIQC
jgi:hypothetical protein